MGFDRLKSGPGGRKGRYRGVNSMRAVSRKKRLPHNFGNYNISPPSTTTISSTGTQTYTVPRRVDTLNITMYGAGAGGGLAAAGGSRGNPINEGGGGGGGSKLVFTLDELTPGTILTFNVGAGGAKGSNANDCSADGGNTTLSYGGTDFVAGGGEGNMGGGDFPSCSDDGTGGVADCDSFGNCTGTNGNDGTAKNNNSTQAGGAALGDSAGAGGQGSSDNSSQDNADGDDGKVIIS